MFHELLLLIRFLEAERRLRELEEERQKLDKELHRAQDKINITEKCMTELQTTVVKVSFITFLHQNWIKIKYCFITSLFPLLLKLIGRLTEIMTYI